MTASRAIRRRVARLTVAGLVVAGLVATAPASPQVVAGAGTTAPRPATFGAMFANPPASARPLTYWWLPDPATMDTAGVEQDVTAMADAGLGGVLPYREEFALPVDEHGRDLLRTTLSTAKRRGMTVDLSLGITWGIPNRIGRPEAAEQELVYGTAFLTAGQTFDGALPAPSVGSGPDRPRSLVAAVAARCTNRCRTQKPVRLDQDTLVDLTDRVDGDAVEWTAPAGAGEWVLIGFWQRDAVRSYGGAPPTGVVNRLSAVGAEAVTDYLDRQVLTPEISALLEDAGGALHEDSIHLAGYHLWTDDFLAQFEQRRGYSLRKYLPVSIIGNVNAFGTDPVGMSRHPEAAADFDFAGDGGKRIRNDYFRTLGELWQQRYLATLQQWAHGRGLEFRAQVAYGQTFSIDAAAEVDVPMVEAFQLADTLDGYRSMAGAVHLGGRNLWSSECCVTVTRILDDNYSTTWQRMLSVIHNNFAAGVNQITLHGVTYPDAPGAAWPGFNNFTDWQGAGKPGISDEFGPRMPYWQQTSEVMDFLSREQLVLRQGKPQLDVAFYRHGFWEYSYPLGTTPSFFGECKRPGGCELVNDHTLERAGYTYEFVSPELFDLPTATVRDGRLGPGGPAYKALVLDSGLRHDVDGMPLDAARKILAYARSGLPVVIVGDLPDGTGFFADADQDAEVRRTLAQLVRQPRVRRVSSQAEIAGALKSLGIRAAAQPRQPSNLLTFRRTAGDVDYYFVWNQNRIAPATGKPEPRAQAFDQEVSFEGSGQPFTLDAWTGKIIPIGTYQRQGDRVTTRVSLAPGESALIAIGREGWQRAALGSTPGPVHATSTTADEVVKGEHGDLRVRADRPGGYLTELSDGRVVRSTIGKVPTARTLSDWHLSVEDWQPGDTATQTRKVRHELDLDRLRPWPDIPELRDVSGRGTYTARVTLDQDWTGADRGARLELDPLLDSARLEVNGKDAGYLDPDNPVTDVTRFLRRGTNTIRIEVATTLRNRLRTLLAPFAGADRQPSGLAGQVRLVPYREAVVARR